MNGTLRFHEPRRGRFEGATDVVVVGSGAAGAAAADVFSEAGLRVIVVEEGRLHPPGSFTSSFRDTLNDVYRGFGAVPARGRGVMPLVQARAVGGTTVVGGGGSWRLPSSVHAEWRAAGFAEGLGEAALHREYDLLDRLLDVSPVAETVVDGDGGLPGRGAAYAGTSRPVPGRGMPRRVDAPRWTLGCPNGAKSSMDRSLLLRSASRGVGILAGARVDRLERDRTGRARGVVGVLVDGQGKRYGHFKVLAERAVVLAASATATPILLARSRVTRGVGAGFMAHPGLCLLGLFRDPLRPGRGPMPPVPTDSDDTRVTYESLSLPASILLSRMPGIGDAARAGVGLLPHIASWGVRVRARAQGTVRAGWFGRSIRYDPTDEDVAIAARGLRDGAQMMFEAGAEAVFPGIHGLPDRLGPDDLGRIEQGFTDPRQGRFVAAHFFGGAVRGPNPAVHPVDENFEVRALPGAFVVDSSTFPGNLGVAPQHTMSAVARLASWRITEHFRRSRFRPER